MELYWWLFLICIHEISNFYFLLFVLYLYFFVFQVFLCFFVFFYSLIFCYSPVFIHFPFHPLTYHIPYLLSKRMSPGPHHHPTRLLHYLGLQVPWQLDTSSPTEAKSGSPLLYRCQGPHISCVCSLVGGSVSEQSQGCRLVETAGLSIGSPSSSAYSCLSLMQPLVSPTSVHCLGVSICFWLFQLLLGLSEDSHTKLLFVSTP
jgi:hypothetical protein